MNWRKYFPTYDVPHVLDSMVRGGVLRDLTKAQDSHIHFEGKLRNGDTLVLWIDHPSPYMRVPGGSRFELEIWEEDKTPEKIMETDSVENVSAHVQELLEKLGGPRLV